MLTISDCPAGRREIRRVRHIGRPIVKPVWKAHLRSTGQKQAGGVKLRLEAPSAQAIWFVYDGQCPICATAAAAFQVREAVGTLHLVNAREDAEHPVLGEVNAARLDLDLGMVIKYGGRLYHGADALQLMALIGSERGWLNRMNALMFRNRLVARFAYPFMRAARNLAIALKGSGKIRNLGPQA
jgi:predicted DCC family thiol-disulfide oxidoreductase YuxK